MRALNGGGSVEIGCTGFVLTSADGATRGWVVRNLVLTRRQDLDLRIACTEFRESGRGAEPIAGMARNTPADNCNSIGQMYHGPVVLITSIRSLAFDAYCILCSIASRERLSVS